MIPRRVLRLNRISVCVSARERKSRGPNALFPGEVLSLALSVHFKKKNAPIFSSKSAAKRQNVLSETFSSLLRVLSLSFSPSPLFLSLSLCLFFNSPFFLLACIVRTIHSPKTVLKSGFCSYSCRLITPTV